MLFSSWLRNCKSSLERRAELRRTRRATAASRTASGLFLERLEERCLLSTQILNYNPTLTDYSQGITQNAAPDYITGGPDGNVWFTESNDYNIAQITPTGSVKEIPYNVTAGPAGPIITGPNPDDNYNDTALWFASGPYVMEMDPKTDIIQTVKVWPADVGTLALDPQDNNVWFTEKNNNYIGYIDHTTGQIYQFSVGFEAYNIVWDPNDSAFWYDSSGGSGPSTFDMIGSITTSGQAQSYSLPGHGVFRGMAVGSDGNLWVGEPGNGFVGEPGNSPSQIDRVVVPNQSNGLSTPQMTSFLTPNPISPYDLVADKDGGIWFDEAGLSQIGRITTDGIITEYPTPTFTPSFFSTLTLGPDGNIWFTESSTNKIGEVVLYNQQAGSTPPVTQTAIPGISQNINLGSFTDTDATGNWTLTVNWGDSPTDTTTLTNITSVGDLGNLAHTYASQGVYTVNETLTNTSDSTDTPGTASFQVVVGPVVVNTNNTGPGSLSQAIQEVNDYPSLTNNGTTQADITFNIPTTDPNYQNGQFTIHTTGLPTITEPVFLDGYSQPGASANTNAMGDPNHPSDNAVRKIVLDGSQAIPYYSPPYYTSSLLSITGSDSTIRGLVIQNAPSDAIDIMGSGASGDVIEGNYIDGSKVYGIDIQGGSNNIIGYNTTIGGTDPSARNIIGGGRGVFIAPSQPATISSEVLADQLNSGAILRQVATGTIAQADMSDQFDPANGDWPYNNPVPRVGGGGAFNYAFVATGTLQVNTAGTYTFALGSADGSRLSIDGQVVVDEPNPEASFADTFGSVTLSAGTHTIEWTGYQESGSAGFELSVAVGGGKSGPVTTANGWHVLGDPNPDPAIDLQGSLAVTVSYAVWTGGQDNVIAGNYIGLDATGKAIIPGLGDYGVTLDGESGNIVGGTTTLARNVISGWQKDQVILNWNGFLTAPGAGVVVEGNYIGTDATGTIGFVSNPASSTTTGITGTDNAVISDNLISGLGTGISPNGSGVTIQGNKIGTDATGTQPLPNGVGVGGIFGFFADALVGGTTPGMGNIIAFNDGPAINLGSNTQIEGNSIFNNADSAIYAGSNEQIEGNSIFNNAGPAVSVFGTGSEIEGNSIYGNGGPAIDNLDQYGDNIGPTLFDANWPGGPFTGTDTSTITVTSLSQSGNTLTFDGTLTGGLKDTRYFAYLWTTYPDGNYRGEYYTYITTVDSGNATFTKSFTAPPNFPTTQGSLPLSYAFAQDYPPHSQGNDEQNYPVLTSASSGSTSIVSGTLNGADSTTFTVDVYANPTADPSGYGQGQYYLGQSTVTTDANGNASFSADFSAANLPGGVLPAGWSVSATATDLNGNTSEFSQDLTTAPATQTFSQYLAGVIPQNSSSPAVISIQAGPDQTPATVVDAVNSLTNVDSQYPVTIIYDLGGGTYSASGVNADPPSSVALIIQNGTLTGGANGFTITGGNVTLKNVTLDPDHPALTVAGGQVSVINCTLTTSGNAPTLFVTGGSVALSNDSISQTSTTSVEPAIAVTGGTVNLGSATSPGNNTLSVSNSGDLVSNTSGNPISAVGDTFTVNGLPLTPSTLSGTVFEDFNDDGQIDFGEEGIANVLITLTGTDDLGNAVSQSQLTDADGAYVFLNLRPGNYTITETQPSGYAQGIDSVGTAGGTLSATDQFSVSLAPEVNGLNYNFGEQPAGTGPVTKGQTAGIGFWNNKNGQALIKSFNGGSTSTQLGDWLAATLPHMFGANAGSNDLAGKSNADIAALFQSDFLAKGVKLNAQVLATALSVYATNATLDDTDVAASYGFIVSGNGLGTATVNVGSNGAAFGVADNTVLTVLDLLKATDAQAVGGLLYNGDATLRKQANNVYSAINEEGDIG